LVFVWTQRKLFSGQKSSIYRKGFSLFLVSYAWLALSSVVLTNSRSGVAGFIFFCFLFSFRIKGFGKKTGTVLLIVLCLLVGWNVMDQSHRDRFRTLWDESAGPESAAESAAGRWSGFLAGLEAFRRYPVFGVGPDSFVPYRAAHIDGSATQTHNLAGEVLGKTGILGTLFFASLVYAALVAARRLRRSNLTAVNRYARMYTELGCACRDTLLLLLFLGLGGHNLFRPQWLWMAAFLEITRTLERNSSDSQQLNNAIATTK